MTLSVFPVPGFGAEDVAVATSGPYEGSVFTGTEDGSIFRVSHDGSRIDRVANTRGRPLGIEMDGEDRLLVADTTRGMLRVDIASGQVEMVLDQVGGKRLVFANNAGAAEDGTIFFSESSQKFGLADWKSDFVQNTRTGRLVAIAPDGGVTVLIDQLAFANGVAVSKNQDFVVVAETGGRCIHRYWLTGNRSGMRDLFAQNLPGYPDNVALGSDGLFWVAIASPTNPLVERIMDGPMWVRRNITRLPDRVQPKPERTIRIQAFNDEGTLVHDLDLPTDSTGSSFHMATGVREHDGTVWIGSLEESAVARHRL